MTVVAITLGKSTSFGGIDVPLEEPEEKPKVKNTIPNLPIAEFRKMLGTIIKKLLI